MENQEKPPENNEVIMQMSPWDFDQSSDGWRRFEMANGRIATANLIQEYIVGNKDRILNPPKGERKVSLEIMYFHIGQLLAFEGQEH